MLLTLNSGIYSFNEDRQQFEESPYNKELKKILAKKFVNQIICDEFNNLWLLIDHRRVFSIKNNIIRMEFSSYEVAHELGFFVFNITDSLRLYGNLIEENSKPNKIRIEKVNKYYSTVSYDKPISIHGPVGVRLSNGDELLCYKNDVLRYKGDKVISRFNLGNSYVMRIFEDRKRNIWLCTQIGGLYKFTDGIIDLEHCEQFFIGKNISNIFMDRNDNLWVGTVGYGSYLVRYGEITRYLNDNKIRDLSIINNKLFAVNEYGRVFEYDSKSFEEKFCDSNIEIRQILSFQNKPLLLFSTFNNKTKISKHYSKIESKSAVIADSNVYSILNNLTVYNKRLRKEYEINFETRTTCILKLDNNSVLVGTQKGLFKYVRGRSPVTFSTNRILNNSHIKAICQDSFNFYISVLDSGLYSLNRKTLELKPINKYLIGNDIITSLFVENNNCLWACSNSTCFQLKHLTNHESFYLNNTFSIDNGIFSGDINKIMIFKKFYFISTSKGIYRVPINFKVNIQKGTFYFERLSTKSGIYIERPVFKTTISPKKDERTIEVEFANTLIHKEEPAYRYRLLKDNVYSDWNFTNSELIQLTNLTNGSYELEVTDAKGNSNTITLIFKIPPFFRETWVFKVLWILILLSIFTITIYQVFRFQRTKRNLAESRLLSMQTKLNPHFIFNSINSMQHLIFNKNFETSNRYIIAFSELMRKCFEFADKDFIKLVDEIKFVEKYLQIEQIKKQFDYELIIDKEIDLEEAEIPPLFLQPVLENSIKHGLINEVGRKLLEIEVTTISKALKIIIKNSGINGNIGDFSKKDGSLIVLFQRIEYLRSIYRTKIFGLYFENKDEKTIVTLILPANKS